MIRFCLLLALLFASTIHAQQGGSGNAGSGDGARALWEEFMTRMHAEYYEVVDEVDLTRKAIDMLSAEGPAFASLPKPREYGPDAVACRTAFHQYILAFALKAGRRMDPITATELAIQRLCERQLRFAQYIPASVQAELASLGKAGLGMRIEVSETGRFYCQPFPGEAAALAGIEAGDELIALDTVPVEGMNRWKLKIRLYGADGSTAEVRVRQPTGRIITAQLTRRLSEGPRVTVKTSVGGTTIKIPIFDENTLADLRDALKKVRPTMPLTLDLRGNGGGSITPAVDAAALFLDGPRPLLLARQQRRGQPDVELTSNEPVIPGFKRLLVLMDGGTASSAELFIALLSESTSPKVSLSGARTYGKDLWNETGTLKNGGGDLILPVGALVTQGGKSWPKGIEPTFGVKK